jgi:L-malate glycosyltransferase
MPESLTILQLVTSRKYRGAEVFAANLSKELILKGYRIFFVGLYEPESKPLAVEGCQHVDLQVNKQFFFSIQGCWRLVKLMRAIKPDIIQANGSDTLKYALVARLFTGYRPVIYRNISIISVWVGKSILKRMFYSWLFRGVDHVSSVGNESKNDFQIFFNYPNQKISVIRRGIPIKEFDAVDSRNQLLTSFYLRDDVQIVMHVGNFSKEKNHIFLLDVFALIKQQNANVKLVLVGEGAEYDRIRSEVQFRDLQDTIYFTGFRKDIENLLPGADVLVLSSLVEGVPGVILEAATFQVPTVAVDVGGVSEVIKDNETGILVKHHDVVIFEKTVLELLANDAKRQRLGVQAYEFVSKEFNPVLNAEKFIGLYKSLLK